MIAPAFQSIHSIRNQKAVTAEVLSRWLVGGEVYTAGTVQGNIQWGDVDLEIILMLIKGIPMVRSRYQTLLINVSQQTLESDSRFITWLAQLVRLRSLSSLSIIIEITEEVDEVTLMMRWDEINHKGFDMAMDDYGKLNSTFERLQSFPWSVCKFDVRNIINRSPDFLRGLQYCHDRKITVVGEKVESQHLSVGASEAGIDLQQGFFYDYPHLLLGRKSATCREKARVKDGTMMNLGYQEALQ